VVLLDIGMPRLDGYEVARHLRQQGANQEMLLVALTGWGQESDRQRAEAAGFDAHLTKPVDYERLTELLQPPLRRQPASTGAGTRRARSTRFAQLR